MAAGVANAAAVIAAIADVERGNVERDDIERGDAERGDAEWGLSVGDGAGLGSETGGPLATTRFAAANPA